MGDDSDNPRIAPRASGVPAKAVAPADVAKFEALLRETEKRPQPTAIDRLIDLMIDDVLKAPGGDLLAEVAADQGKPEKLAIEYDALVDRALKSKPFDAARTPQSANMATRAIAWGPAIERIAGALLIVLGGAKLLGAGVILQALKTLGLGEWFRLAAGSLEIFAGALLCIPQSALGVAFPRAVRVAVPTFALTVVAVVAVSSLYHSAIAPVRKPTIYDTASQVDPKARSSARIDLLAQASAADVTEFLLTHRVSVFDGPHASGSIDLRAAIRIPDVDFASLLQRMRQETKVVREVVPMTGGDASDITPGTLVVVSFVPAALIGDVIKSLRAQNFTLVDGPLSDRSYVVRVGPTNLARHELNEIVDRWRKQSSVVLLVAPR